MCALLGKCTSGRRKACESQDLDSNSDQEAPSTVSSQRSAVQSKRSGPSGLPRRVQETVAMQQEELRCVKVLLWESKAESGQGPWDQVIQAVKGSSGVSLAMIRDVVHHLDTERHRFKRKWQLACMMIKYNS